MKMQMLPWINDDVAVEIIGKMIAEQVRALNEVLDTFDHVGLDEDSAAVQANKDYQYHKLRIKELNTEIRQIYKRGDVTELLEKVWTEYAPYIKGRLIAHQTVS